MLSWGKIVVYFLLCSQRSWTLQCISMTFVCLSVPIKYKASKEGTVMGVAVSKISMLTHCQALTQACNYCEGQSSGLVVYISFLCLTPSLNSFLFFGSGETLVNVLDCKKDMGLWHGVLTVRWTQQFISRLFDCLCFQHSVTLALCLFVPCRVSWTESTPSRCHMLSWKPVQCPGCRGSTFIKVWLYPPYFLKLCLWFW